MKIGFRGCTSCDFTTLQALYNSGGLYFKLQEAKDETFGGGLRV